MASILLSLANKAREDGKYQVLVRIGMGRSIRFRLRTEVYVSLDYWNEDKKQVVVPVNRKINKTKVDEAKMEKANLDSYIRDLSEIIDAVKTAI